MTRRGRERQHHRTKVPALFVELTAEQRAMVEEKAQAEDVSIRELVVRAVAAYRPASPAERLWAVDRITALEERVAKLEAAR